MLRLPEVFPSSASHGRWSERPTNVRRLKVHLYDFVCIYTCICVYIYIYMYHSSNLNTSGLVWGGLLYINPCQIVLQCHNTPQNALNLYTSPTFCFFQADSESNLFSQCLTFVLHVARCYSPCPAAPRPQADLTVARAWTDRSFLDGGSIPKKLVTTHN